MHRYGADLDSTMRNLVDRLPQDTPGFAVMARYPLGWVNEYDRPYPHATGKRIRPLFLLLCNEAAGGDWYKALPAAAAVELLHNFSLVHDDIQDDSPIRHGRPTVWKLWGIANAINAGDALFSLAYNALESLSDEVDSEVVIKVWRIFNYTNLMLTKGQHLDMRFEYQEQVSVQQYIEMITGKSAALLAACAQMGALIASGDEQLAARYGEFALNLGIAFQIRDDILGIWGNPDVTGKSAATDIVSRKKSLPVLYGLQNSQRLHELYQQDRLEDANVREAVQILDSVNAHDYARGLEMDYYERALAKLSEADPQGKTAEMMQRFVATLFQRTY